MHGANFRVPFVDLRPANNEAATQIEDNWNRVVASSRFVGGEFVDRFENEWASYCDVRHCVGVSDGTAAIKLALQALGVGRGDEVIVPANTFVATWEAVAELGAVPIPVDVDPGTLLMTGDSVSAACGPRTAAVIPVHLFGQLADMDAIVRVARQRGIYVIEDAAQAHGALFCGRKAGSFADVGCFSFYPGKNLGALGDAGAIVTDSGEVASRVRSLGNHGRDPTHCDRHNFIGMNHRLDNLQAAFLSAKLPFLDGWNSARRRIAERYRTLLEGLPIEIVGAAAGSRGCYHLFVIRVSQRDMVKAQLERLGIATGIHYRIPCHRQPAFNMADVQLPITERAADEILSLPMYPHLSEGQIERVAGALRQIFSGTTLQHRETGKRVEFLAHT